MNELQTFTNELFGEVRTVLIKSEVWFVLIDVCRALDLTNPTMVANRLDEDEVTKFDLGGLSGLTNIVNESGLYKVIFRSDKKEAKPFTKWVTNGILPSIRKHGTYATEELLNDPDLFIKVLTDLKKEREEKKQLQDKVMIDAPKVLFADSVSASKTTILVRELATILKQNGIDTGEKRLYKSLRNNGYLVKDPRRSDYNMPTQKSMNLKLFDFKETVITHSKGDVEVKKTTKVTGNGQQYFVKKFLSGDLRC